MIVTAAALVLVLKTMCVLVLKTLERQQAGIEAVSDNQFGKGRKREELMVGRPQILRLYISTFLLDVS